MATVTNEDFKITLMEARVNRGLSRKEVEEKTGISAGMLLRYENGQSEPKAKALQALCALYVVSIDMLDFENAKPILSGRGRKKSGR